MKPLGTARRRAVLLSALLTFATVSLASAQRPISESVPSIPADGYERQPGLDVLHYDILIELPGEGSEIAGRTAILYQSVAQGLERFWLDLGAAMVVDSVAVDGYRTAFERAGDRLTIESSSTAGSRSEVTIWYHGTPSDGLIVGLSRHGRRTVFADNWADRAHHWFPSLDHPSDKATVELVVEAAGDLEVVGNGVLAGREELDGARARTRWIESAEIPVYGLVIGVADFAIETAGTVNGIEVSHWTFPEDSAAGAVAFARSAEVLAFYDSLFGPYPYEKLAHVQSATKFGGMENPGAIFYDQDRIGGALGADEDDRDGLTSLVAHETVHQWFGDAVTEADWNHLWLSEGFAEYFDAVFFEFHGGAHGSGAAELSRQMARRAEEVRELEASGAQSIYSPGAGPGEYETLLDAENYEKGAWVLHMLRHLVGDRPFFEGIRDYYATLRDGVAWTADFVRIMEEASGQRLGWFFGQWLDRPGIPVLATTMVESAGGRRLRIDQLQPGEPYRLNVEVELRGADGPARRVVEMESSRAEIPLEREGAVEVVVDPDGWLLYAPGVAPSGREATPAP